MGFGKHELSTINFALPPPPPPPRKKIYMTPLPPHNNNLYSKRVTPITSNGHLSTTVTFFCPQGGRFGELEL